MEMIKEKIFVMEFQGGELACSNWLTFEYEGAPGEADEDSDEFDQETSEARDEALQAALDDYVGGSISAVSYLTECEAEEIAYKLLTEVQG